MRIGLFITCVCDTLFPEAGRATVRVLERLGHEVVFPAGQTCCGQMHVNSGYADDALPLIRGFADAFDDAGLDAIVAPSGSCVASVRHAHEALALESGDRGLADASRRIGARVFELSEFLVGELGVLDVGARFPHTVTYHPSCHSLRLLRVGDAPRRLLQNVSGLTLVDLPEADACCGFGGTFSVKNPDVSAAMLADKMRAVLSTGAEVVACLDSSCLMQIGGGLARGRAGVRTMHVAEILAGDEPSAAADAGAETERAA